MTKQMKQDELLYIILMEVLPNYVPYILGHDACPDRFPILSTRLKVGA